LTNTPVRHADLLEDLQGLLVEEVLLVLRQMPGCGRPEA